MRISLLLLIAALLAGCTTEPDGCDPGEEPQSGTSVCELAPDFSYSDTEGEVHSLSDYAGQVLLIYIFGNSCNSCLLVGDDIERVYQRSAADRRFAAIGLDVFDQSSTVASVVEFAAQTGITFPLCLQAGSITRLFDTTSDRLIVIDQDGVFRFKGETLARTDIQEVAHLITGLLD